MFNEILKKVRIEKGVTQQTVADFLNVKRPTYTRYENGTNEPDSQTMAKLADYFGITVDYLLGRDEPTKKAPTDVDADGLNARDEKDIAKRLDKLLEDMNFNDGLMFDGEVFDEETKELLRASLESDLRMAKAAAKSKYTPKKYRK